MTYAQRLGFRPATASEKLTRGFLPGTRAYTSSTGEVISHRQLQTRGLAMEYNLDRPSLESRAQYRAEQGYEYRKGMGPSSRRTFDRMVHHNAVTPVKQGGMGLRYDRKTRGYIDPRTGERFGFQDIARNPEFRDKETGTWQQWQRIRHIKGPRGQRQRFNFLRRYGFLQHIGGGKYRYVA